MQWHELRIDIERFQNDFNELAEIGSTGDGGVNRPAFGEAHLAARRWFQKKVEKSGLEFLVDGAGNHSAVLRGEQEDEPTFLIGSHLDSVMNGGRFDGALGVLSGLEILRTIKESGVSLPVHLEVIDFSDEEGTLFGLLGSQALVGSLKTEELEAPRGGREEFLAGLARAGLKEDNLFSARREPESLAGYLELHIEQGRRLEKAGVEIGIVSAIVGICSYQLVFQGEANHAGTTTMEDRLDAGLGASEFVLEARRLVVERYTGCVVNVGRMDFSPGAYNIIPGEVRLALEFRSAVPEQYAALENDLLRIADNCADKYGLGLTLDFRGRHQPNQMSTEMQQSIRKAADLLELSSVVIRSGAGHDAQTLAEICPAGMLFIPSVGGISHSPDEFSKWEDCVNGANVLLQSILNWVLA